MAQVLVALESVLIHIVGGRESVVFLAPMGAYHAIAFEAWQVLEQWDLQTDENDMVHAVRYGVPEGDPEQTQTLASLKSRITTAAAADAHADTRISNASGLTQYYRDIGAYGDITPGRRLHGHLHTGTAACGLHLRQRYGRDEPRDQPWFGTRLRGAAGG